MVKVKLLVAMAGTEPRNVGDLHECDAAEAARLIEAGFAEAVAGKPAETATKALPRAKRRGGVTGALRAALGLDDANWRSGA